MERQIEKSRTKKVAAKRCGSGGKNMRKSGEKDAEV
jgi:hypothetical protein